MKLVAYTVDTAFGPVDSLGALQGEEVVDNAGLTADGEPNLEALAVLLESTSMN
jgi:hypothetical protein